MGRIICAKIKKRVKTPKRETDFWARYAPACLLNSVLFIEFFWIQFQIPSKMHRFSFDNKELLMRFQHHGDLPLPVLARLVAT
jgi:hypothetical protein